MFTCKEGVIKPIVYLGVLKDRQLLLVDYAQAPNPARSGWWIPAPGLSFGEDPDAKALALAMELGVLDAKPRLLSTESFVTPGGWHLVYHYTVNTSAALEARGNYRGFRWVSAETLKGMTDIAHGKWEIGVGLRYLSGNHS